MLIRFLLFPSRVNKLVLTYDMTLGVNELPMESSTFDYPPTSDPWDIRYLMTVACFIHVTEFDKKKSHLLHLRAREVHRPEPSVRRNCNPRGRLPRDGRGDISKPIQSPTAIFSARRDVRDSDFDAIYGRAPRKRAIRPQQ